MSTSLSAEEKELLDIRRTIIVAIASDDALMERLVLKGGNALDIVYGLSDRSSLDIDFSMSGDFKSAEEMEMVRQRLFAALRDRFDSLGFVVFDDRLEQRPPTKAGFAITVWGGYSAKFKLISKTKFQELGGILGNVITPNVLEALRRQSQVSGPNSYRTFEIEISKFEITEGRIIRSVENYDCYVYTPAMIAAEKLRAVCQQMPEYELRAHPAPRARDFYDIHTIATKTDCDLAHADHRPLLQQMFEVKRVPYALLKRVGDADVREFHRQQWSAVANSVRGGPAQDFDFYFEFVATIAPRVFDSVSG